jgi:hypothetical protein
LSNVGQLEALLGSAKSYLVTDQGWNLFNFSTSMKALTGKNLQFYTAPITGYATIEGQAANQVDLPTVQSFIAKKFTAATPGAKPSGSASGQAAAKAPPASSVTVDVYNGGSAQGLATGVSTALVAKGYKAGLVTNASAQSKTPAVSTQVFYGAGTSANAAKIAGYFGAAAAPLTALAAGHVEVLIGTGTTVVPAGLGAATATGAGTATPSGATPSTSTSPGTAGDNGASGGAVTVTAKAKFGVPCIY